MLLTNSASIRDVLAVPSSQARDLGSQRLLRRPVRPPRAAAVRCVPARNALLIHSPAAASVAAS
jgi:hypothetical protein